MNSDYIWITKNGNHIKIKNNQSPMDAFIRQISERKKDNVLKIKHSENELNEMRKEQNKILKKDGIYKIDEDKDFEYIVSTYDMYEDGNLKNTLYLKNKKTGYFESTIDFYYDDINDLVKIEFLHTNDQFKRKGNATKIMNVLQKRIAGENNDMYLGSLEPDGEKFVNSKMEITKQEVGESKSMLYWGKMKKK